MSGSWRLRVERGPNAGQSFSIDQPSATIGRQDHNAVVLDDARLSRQHARIDIGPGGLTVTDLNSANGTLVNGRTVVGSMPISAGDRLQLGDTILIIEGGAPQFGGGDAAGATVVAGPPAAGAGSPAAPGADVPRLVVQGSGVVFRLDRPSLVIGRQPDIDLPLEDTQASRQHARFDTRDGQVTITDLGSANGTKVNGTRISMPTALNDGDLIQVGTSQLRIEGVAFVDHGTAIALGFYPPPPSDRSLETMRQSRGAPAPDAQPVPEATSPFAPPPDAGATIVGGPPPMADQPAFGAPPPVGGPPPFGTPPQFAGGPPPAPPGAPGQPWNVPPGPQYGGAPPVIQPPMPPAGPARTRRSGPPIVLIALAIVVLLACVGGGVAVAAFARRGSDPTATPSTMHAATPMPMASSTPMPAAGSSGGNVAPPPPGASPAPSSGGLTPTAGPAPSAAPSTAAVPSGSAAPRATVAPTARATAAQGATGNKQVQSVGLTFKVPTDWLEISNTAGKAQYTSPDGRAILVIRWSTQVASGLTAQQVILQELADTQATDPTFDPNGVRVGSVSVGGQQGYGTDIYSYMQSGRMYSEADRAVVLSGRAQYFFGFVAEESAFQTYAATFDDMIASIRITGP